MSRWLCGWVCLTSALCASAQDIDLRIVRDPAVLDYDFSWVYWFETHGRGYLDEAVSDRPLPWDTPASRRWKGEAITALRGLLADRNDAVRAAAILALARAGYEPLEDVVLLSASDTGATSGDEVGTLLDESDEVRMASWLALGLIDTERCRAALAAPPMEDVDEIDLVSQAAAIGLMREPSKAHLRWLVARLDNPDASAEVRRWCVWALGQHDSPAFDAVYDKVLTNLPSTFVMSEVLLIDGYAQRRGGADWLKQVLRYHPDVQGWAGYRALDGVPEFGIHGSTARRLAMETRIAATLSLAQQPILEDAEDRRDLLKHLHRRMVAGNSAQAMDFNRGFDTISYMMHCHAEEDDLDLLYDQLRGFTQVPADDPAVLEGLEEGELPSPEDLVIRQSDNEVRGYAALAAGLLIRRATEGTALFNDRPIVGRRSIEIERIKRRFGVRLMRAVADEDEPVSYRAACALALGLTGDQRYAAELTVELGRLRAGDEAVLGYGLLGLALLGEERAAEPARRYLTRPGLIQTQGDLLGRRAALDAIAVLGRRGGADVGAALGGAWGRNAWVGLNVAEATARSGVYDALPGMIESATSESPRWRRAAAVGLGLVFDRSCPSRLSRISRAGNPTLTYLPRIVRAQDPPAAPPEADGPADWPKNRLLRFVAPSVPEGLWP